MRGKGVHYQVRLEHARVGHVTLDTADDRIRGTSIVTGHALAQNEPDVAHVT